MITTGRERATFPRRCPTSIVSLDYSPDGEAVALGDHEGTITRRGLATGREPIPSLGIARDVAGNARISWTGQGWLLQGTTELNSNPAATVWQDLPQFSSSPLDIPAGYFGSGPTNVFFRLICK